MEKEELIGWLIEHAPLLPMCEAGGWPDLEHMNIEICHRDNRQWVIIVEFNEQLREISVCDPVIYKRCAKFSITLDGNVEPAEIRLITRM